MSVPLQEKVAKLERENEALREAVRGLTCDNALCRPCQGIVEHHTQTLREELCSA